MKFLLMEDFMIDKHIEKESHIVYYKFIYNKFKLQEINKDVFLIH